MKTVTKMIIALTATLALSLPAFAGGYHHYKSSGLSINLGGYHNGVSLRYRLPVKYHNYKRYDHKYKYKRYNRSYRSYYKPRYNNHRYYKPYSYYSKPSSKHSGYVNNHDKKYQRSCHPVNKTVIDRHGYTQKIGGTMCYNKKGVAYIVPGSGYHMH